MNISTNIFFLEWFGSSIIILITKIRTEFILYKLPTFPPFVDNFKTLLNRRTHMYLITENEYILVIGYANNFGTIFAQLVNFK